MICSRCLYRASHRASPQTAQTIRHYTTATGTSSARPTGPPAATSTAAAQPFSTPLKLANPIAARPAAPLKAPPGPAAPRSSVPAGQVLKGLNYFKNAEDPVALKDSEYPPWLFKILQPAPGTTDGSAGPDDMYSKSSKLRRAAVKRAKKIEELKLARGEVPEVVIPLQQQTVDLPGNPEGTVAGALEALRARQEVRVAMRAERKKNIKTANYLKGMR